MFYASRTKRTETEEETEAATASPRRPSCERLQNLDKGYPPKLGCDVSRMVASSEKLSVTIIETNLRSINTVEILLWLLDCLLVRS